jgi:hypothetical protein
VSPLPDAAGKVRPQSPHFSPFPDPFPTLIHVYLDRQRVNIKPTKPGILTSRKEAACQKPPCPFRCFGPPCHQPSKARPLPTIHPRRHLHHLHLHHHPFNSSTSHILGPFLKIPPSIHPSPPPSPFSSLVPQLTARSSAAMEGQRTLHLDPKD